MAKSYEVGTKVMYKDLEKAMKDNGVGWEQLNNIIDTLVTVGYLSPEEAALRNNKLEEMLGAYRDNDSWDYIWNLFNLSSTDKSLNRVMQAVIEYLNGDYYDFDAVKDAVDAISSSGPGQYYASAPDYISYLLEGQDDIDIHQAHLMNAEEMADLYNLNIDPQSYYDMVKQSTEAGVEFQDYLDAQASNAQTLGELAGNASYLDAIRNNKSEAVSKGASKGALAAQQILDTINANSTFGNNYAEGIKTRGDAYQQAYYNNAYAQQTADSIYGSLMGNVMNNSLGMFSSDVSRYASDLSAKALMYGADVNSLANRYALNSDMYSAYVQSLANSNNAYSQTGGQANEFANLFNIFKTAYGGNMKAAIAAMQPIITGSYANGNKEGSMTKFYSNLKD